MQSANRLCTPCNGGLPETILLLCCCGGCCVFPLVGVMAAFGTMLATDPAAVDNEGGPNAVLGMLIFSGVAAAALIAMVLQLWCLACYRDQHRANPDAERNAYWQRWSAAVERCDHGCTWLQSGHFRPTSQAMLLGAISIAGLAAFVFGGLFAFGGLYHALQEQESPLNVPGFLPGVVSAAVGLFALLFASVMICCGLSISCRSARATQGRVGEPVAPGALAAARYDGEAKGGEVVNPLALAEAGRLAAAPKR